MRNRWLIALAAIGIHISIGSVYAWSVLTRPIMAEMGITLSETTGVFSTAILFLGITTCFLGNFVEKIGPKKSGLLSTAFFALAMFGTYLAISWHTLPLVYLFYGVLGGVGIGIGYMAPVSTLIRYFPHNRGLATGLAIMGFGFATLFAGPTMQQVTATFGIAENFLIMGTLYVAIMLAASLYLKPPADSMACTHAKTLVETGPTAADALKTWQFASLWWVFFVNIACGIALFALAAPMAQDVIGMEPGAAAAMVGLIGLFNGGGRFIWSTVSDYIGRGRMYALFFLMEVIAFWQLGNTRDAFLFQAMIFLITSCSGGGFSVMPAYLTDLFGTRLLGAVHGRILTAWAAAGIVGPMLVSWLRAQTGGYTVPLLFFAGCFVLNFIIALVLQRFGITSAAARFHAAA